jgi:hypothetical protein
MGFRFHRSVKILRGKRPKLGKRGVSTSIGVRDDSDARDITSGLHAVARFSRE